MFLIVAYKSNSEDVRCGHVVSREDSDLQQTIQTTEEDAIDWISNLASQEDGDYYEISVYTPESLLNQDEYYGLDWKEETERKIRVRKELEKKREEQKRLKQKQERKEHELRQLKMLQEKYNK